MRTTARTAPDFSIGIDGLPPAASLMLGGRLYGVRCDVATATLQLAAAALAHALRAGRSSAAITADPAALMRVLAAHDVDAVGALRRGALRILEQSGDYAAKLAAFGAEHFAQELDYFGVPDDGVVVVLGADALFSFGDVQLAARQAEIYGRWFDSSGATGLLLFAGAAPGVRDVAARRAVEDQFAGIAALERDGARLNLRVERWRSAEGSLGGREYGVRIDGAVLSAVGVELATHGNQLLLSPDQNRVIGTQGALPEPIHPPAGWELVPDLQALLGAARGTVAATLLLDHGSTTDLQTLARAVHELRREHGRALKIVVRETSARLRYNHEMLLLRLGASAVIDSGLSLPRCLALIESLRAQTFSGSIDADFDAALAAAMPPPQSGYLPPQEFCDAVGDALRQAGSIDLRCALVRLLLLPELSHLEVLRQCQPTRPGDVFTADDRSVYVFLYACREIDVDQALENHFATPLGLLFENQVRAVLPTAIGDAIGELANRLGTLAIADFSNLIEAPRAAPAPAPRVQPPPRPAPLPASAPAPVRVAPAPRRVERAPEPLGEVQR